jgi:hypothetical protein
MVLFILFPGGNTSPKYWNDYGTNFLSKLKKIGSVYVYKNKFNNACYYNKEKYNHADYPKDIDFGMDYLNPETHVKIIYDEIKEKYNETQYVPIAASAGVFLARVFSNKYKKECPLCVLIDPALTTPKFIKLRLNLLQNTDYSKKITSKKLKILQQKIRDENLKDDTKKLIDVEHYWFAKYAEKKFTTRLSVKTIDFINLDIPEDPNYPADFNNTAKIENCELLKKENGNKYCYKYFINKTHVIINHQECCDEIIDTIRNSLNITK